MQDHAPASRSELNTSATFENFVVVHQNELAYSALVAVAKEPGTCYNPVLVHGVAALGKTHLLHAVRQRVMQTHPAARILFVTGGNLVREFERALCLPADAEVGRELTDFRKKYGDVDYLIVDDLEEAASNAVLLESLGEIFAVLRSRNKQVILASNRPLSEIRDLADKFITCVAGSMTVEIHPEVNACALPVSRMPHAR